LILLAQNLLALLHLPEVAQLIHETIETLIEPRVVAQQAAQLDLLELDHQWQGWFLGIRRRGLAAGRPPIRAAASLFGRFGSRVFGSGPRCSPSRNGALFEHRI
jgi:hypothetical protein